MKGNQIFSKSNIFLKWVNKKCRERLYMPFVIKVNQMNDILKRLFLHQKQININAYIKKAPYFAPK
jgi:hypothetical protein